MKPAYTTIKESEAFDLPIQQPKTMKTHKIIKELFGMAEAAISADESDWGSERQVDAQNAFFIEVEKLVSPEDFAKLEDYCLKATDAEMVSAAINLLLSEKYWPTIMQ